MGGTRVCVDLNGVLDTYAGWQGEVSWHRPRPGAREFLRALAERGHEVVVLTTRDPAEARAWLARHALDEHVADVTDRKPPALVYVDDRAVSFRGDFRETLEAIERFRPHWQAVGPDTHREEDVDAGAPPNGDGGAPSDRRRPARSPGGLG